MKAPADHLPFRQRRDFVLGCSNIFNEEEYNLLIQYGRWLEALVSGLISPITPEQVRFLQVDRGEIEPVSKYELVWIKLKQRREFEATAAQSTHYRVYDEKEAWFPRSEHWRYRG